jgi:hypothetical protein
MKATSALIALTLACGSALAQNTQVETYDLDYAFDFVANPDQAPAMATFAGFDSMGGTRQLTGVVLRTQISAGMDVVVENYDTMAYSAGEWSGTFSLSLLASFQDEGPIVSMGGLVIEGITGDLSAGTGGFPFGSPGDVTANASIDDFINFSRPAPDSSLGYFASGNDLSMMIFTLSDFFYMQPPGSDQFNALAFAESGYFDGTLSLEYSYEVVPAPASAGLLAGLGLVATRRRR